MKNFVLLIRSKRDTFYSGKLTGEIPEKCNDTGGFITSGIGVCGNADSPTPAGGGGGGNSLYFKKISPKKINFTEMMAIKSKFAAIVFILFMIYNLPAYTQDSDCDYSLNVVVQPTYCPGDGIITINLEGPGVDLGYIQPASTLYQAVPQGTDSEDFHSNNVVYVDPGTYTIRTRSLCGKTGETIERTATVTVALSGEEWQTLNFSLTNPRKSMNRRYTGKISILGITGGKGPYKIEFTDYPSAFDVSKKIIYEGTARPSSLDVEDLPPGTYTVTFTDNCTGYRSHTITVEALSSDFPPTTENVVFNSLMYYPVLEENGDKCNAVSVRKYQAGYTGDLLTLWGDWYEYIYYWSRYYEYAFKTQIFNDSESWGWNEFPASSDRVGALIDNSPGVDYVSPYNKNFLIDTDPAYFPRLYLRVKDPEMVIGTENISDPFIFSGAATTYISNSPSYAIKNDCNDYTFSNFLSTTYRLCYPYTIKFVNHETGVIYKGESVNTGLEQINHGEYYAVKNFPAGYYEMELTDAAGYEMVSTLNISENVLNASVQFSNLECRTTIKPYLHFQNNVSAGTRIIYDTERSSSHITPPTFQTITITEDLPGNTYIYAWTTDISQYTVSSSSPYIDNMSGENVYFRILGPCGEEITVGNKMTQQYINVEELEFEFVTDCSGVKIIPLNLADIIKPYYPLQDSIVDTHVVTRLTANQLSGATIQYSNPSNYCSSTSPGDYIHVNKSGTYNLLYRISTVTGCYFSIYLDVTIDAFSLDESKTTAYRCKNSVAGDGYIHVSAKGGSGNFLYTLYEEDQTTEVAPANTTGEFSNWTSVFHKDIYYVKVQDLECNSHFFQRVDVYDLDDAILGWTNQNVYCPGENVSFKGFSLGDLKYEWYYNGTKIKEEKDFEIQNVGIADAGIYTIKIEVKGCENEWVSYDVDLKVADNTMFWKTNAADKNWFNADNWLYSDGSDAASPPASCTTVHIPGYALKYPNLHNDYSPRNIYGFPVCDTIIYHYGSETVYPNYLEYNRAKIQYNFGYYGASPVWETEPAINKEKNYLGLDPAITGLPVLGRARWHLISSPLKHTLSGDFNLGGYPHMYERLYNTDNPMNGKPAYDTFTKSFSTLALSMDNIGHGLALLAPDYYNSLGWNDHRNLEALEGIIEIPFYQDSDPDVLMDYHLQKYKTATSESELWYYDSDKSGFPLLEKSDIFSRDYKGYRFVFEEDDDSVLVMNGTDTYLMDLHHINDNVNYSRRLLVGNPLMCRIDFNYLYYNNYDVIEDYYWIYDSEENHYNHYRVQDASSTLSQHISPLQGFIIELKDSRPSDRLVLPLSGDQSVISDAVRNLPSRFEIASPEIRSSGRQGWINIYGSVPKASGSDSLRIRSKVYFNSDLSDIPKLVYPDGLDKKAETFIVGSDGYLYSERIENGHPDVVKFGLESTYTDEIVFYIQSGGNLLTSVTLCDTETNACLDVTHGGYYKFKHRTDRVESERNGLDTERFRLLLEYDYSQLEGLPTDKVHVHIIADRHSFKVVSNREIDELAIADLSGVTVFTAKNIGNDIYESSVDMPPGLYIINVRTADGHYTKNKILVK